MPIPEFRPDGWLPEGHFTVSWEEVVERFEGIPGSRRAELTVTLLALRDNLRKHDVSGIMVVDGSYISAKEAPGDFDVVLIAPSNIQERKDREPSLATLLDAEHAEQAGYSLFYVQDDSPSLTLLRTMFDQARSGVFKGVVEVTL